MGIVKDVQSQQELNAAIGGGAPAVIHFWASWCEASKQMDQVFSHLCTDFPQVLFLRVEAEEQPEISDAYKVSAVPFFVFCKDGKTVETLEGANPPALANKVAKIAGSTSDAESAAPASLGMAAGPTLLETVKEMAMQTKSPGAETLSTKRTDASSNRLHDLVHSHPVMLFMKGTPDAPKCGFSNKIVDLLNHEGVEFHSFDVLSDEEVRQGLKAFSNWPSYPQLYLKGELIGGSDIVLEMHKSGELKRVLGEKGIVQQEPMETRLKRLVSSHPVMLFMKGKPDAPRCGFSSKVVGALRSEGISFGSFDILSDEKVRQGLKTYSNWPTFPQLYYKGELIGGCDIVLELSKSGELKATLTE